LAVNVEAERKVAQLNDEIQALARNVKIKDQTIQESSVKIELMERRQEVIKRQAEAILDLENKLTSAKKDANKFREDMESLQNELEMEQKNVKSMAMTAGQENQGEFFLDIHYTILIESLVIGAQPMEPENMLTEGSLETSHLLEQVRF
jgi:dynactin 1